jgi:hypothetical protein
MPTYIICSSDPETYSKIEHVNLMPSISNVESTLQVSTINTLANIQILDETDWIDFTLNHIVISPDPGPEPLPPIVGPPEEEEDSDSGWVPPKPDYPLPPIGGVD